MKCRQMLQEIKHGVSITYPLQNYISLQLLLARLPSHAQYRSNEYIYTSINKIEYKIQFLFYF